MTGPVTSPEPQEKTHDWLASLLLRRGDLVMPRFARLYPRLAERPRGWRRQLRRKLAVTVTGAALLLAMAGFGADFAARADAEVVITVANGEVKVAKNGKCSLIEAIQNANNQNTGQPNTDCTAGNPTGADTIVLPKNGVFTLTEANNDGGDYGPNGLPWISSAMTIEGNGSTIQRQEGTNRFRILAVGRKGNLTIKNATITSGEISANNENGVSGGGIFNQGHLILSHSSVIGNQVYSHYHAFGGGIDNRNTLTISGSRIAENEAYSYDMDAGGGGIDNSGVLTITGSTVENNIVSSYSGGTEGGGINNRLGGSVTILNSTIHYNGIGSRWYDSGLGGGINSDMGGTLVIKNSVISGNGTGGNPAFGGGVRIEAGSSATIMDSTFQNNLSISSYYDGRYYAYGGGISSSGDVSIYGSTFYANAAVAKTYRDGLDGSNGIGGAIFNDGNMTITNSSLSNNEASHDGGGLYNTNDLTIINSTVTGNIGSGIVASCQYKSSITRINQTIASGNLGYEAELKYADSCDDAVKVDSHNVFGRLRNHGVEGFSYGASDIIPSVGISAILHPLADNGGPTWTHALPPGSPAIDHAPNNACTAAPVNGVDQRGLPRNRNGAGGMSPNECDIGAFEFQPAEPPTHTPTSTPTATPTPTPTSIATPTATATPTVTPTGTLEPTVEPSPTATATTGPSPTPTTTATTGPTPTPPAYDWHLFVPVVAADLWN